MRSSSMRTCMAAAALLLCMAMSARAQTDMAQPAPMATYTATLHAVYHSPSKPTGTATVTVWNETYAEVSFAIKRIVGAYMAHIHNGTLPNAPGGIVQWAFQSALPNVADPNPINAHTLSGNVPFNPTANGALGLLQNKMAYFNVHTVIYPNGALQGNFV